MLAEIAIGFVGGVAAVLWALKDPSDIGAFARRCVGTASGGSPKSGPVGIAELRAEDRTFADVLLSRPAVPVESVPPEINATTIEHIRSAQDYESALSKVKTFVRDADTAEIITMICGWDPRATDYEAQYRKSFLNECRRWGFAQNIEENPSLVWIGGYGEERTARPDLCYKGRVVVELKSNLTNSSVCDRALGQTLRYLIAAKTERLGPVILVICGDTSPGLRWLVRHYIHNWRTELRLPVTVVFRQTFYEDDPSRLSDMPDEFAS